MKSNRMPLSRHAGFTLVEAVMVIVIAGIIAGMVAVFMKSPIDAYFDTVRRAELTDAADTSLRRMARDVRTALPNSLRDAASHGDQCFEFLPTLGGGRYRLEAGTGAGPFDALEFSIADSSFDVLGQVGLSALSGTNHVVIYNLGIPNADAYAGDNRAQIGTSTTAKISLAAGKKFPLESPGKRFQVVPDHSVVFACVGVGSSAAGDGLGTLYRYTQAISSSQMAACPSTAPPGGKVLAENVSACSFKYTPAVTQRNGLLALVLELKRANEPVRLYHEVHVANGP